MTKQIRSPNVERPSVAGSPVSSFGFRRSFGFRHSSFGSKNCSLFNQKAGQGGVRGAFKRGLVFHLALLTEREPLARTSPSAKVLPASRRQDCVLCRQDAGSTLQFLE